jgi:hypothetical protein
MTGIAMDVNGVRCVVPTMSPILHHAPGGLIQVGQGTIPVSEGTLLARGVQIETTLPSAMDASKFSHLLFSFVSRMAGENAVMKIRPYLKSSTAPASPEYLETVTVLPGASLDHAANLTRLSRSFLSSVTHIGMQIEEDIPGFPAIPDAAGNQTARGGSLPIFNLLFRGGKIEECPVFAV